MRKENNCFNCDHSEVKSNGRIICKLTHNQVRGDACKEWTPLKSMGGRV